MNDVIESVADDAANAAPQKVNEDLAGQPEAFPGFDPKIHRSKNGEPVYKKDGSYALKPGAGSPKSRVSVGAAHADEPVQPSESVAAQAVGRHACQAFFGLNIQLFGDSAKPTPEIVQSMEYAASEYAAAHGITKDIPPGVMLLIVMGGYYGHVFSNPTPRSRVARLAGWIKSKIKRGKNGARTDSGTDGERKNDSGKDVSL